MKDLAVFDFDHTVIDDNSDTAIMKLVDKSKFSSEIMHLHKKEGWTSFMQAVFQVLHENEITQSEMSQLIRNIPEVPGFKELIMRLHDNMDYDVIIISDSNTFFIGEWLEEHNLNSKVLKVFSNPAKFNDNGLLTINMYHLQESCKLSTKNLCKGMIMEDFIKQQSKRGIIYKKVAYVGDGYNDICPILRLNTSGTACCRVNYKCAKLVRALKEGAEDLPDIDKGTKVKASLCFWENGYDILNFLK